MSGRDSTESFAELVGLQELAALRCHEAFSAAREQADARGVEFRRAEEGQGAASARMDAVFARATLCIDRLRFAVEDWSACDRRLNEARGFLSEAQGEEEAARLSCIEAGKRLEWTEGRARKHRRKVRAKREEGQLRAATDLRALKVGSP